MNNVGDGKLHCFIELPTSSSSMNGADGSDDAVTCVASIRRAIHR